jgi:uncharacterized membrane-anchored protein YjiN (DUF445 family)
MIDLLNFIIYQVITIILGFGFYQLYQTQIDAFLAHKCQLILSSQEVSKEIIKISTEVVNSPDINTAVLQLSSTILQDLNLKQDVYKLLTYVMIDLTKDPDMAKLLIEFISQTAMSALDEPVNDKLIKTKVIEIVTSQDVMDTMAQTLMEVVSRDDLKHVIGESAIATISTAIKKHYPKSFGRWV